MLSPPSYTELMGADGTRFPACPGESSFVVTAGISKTLFLLPGRVTHLTPFSHAESDVYLVTLGGAGLILHADEQALRLRASNAKRYTAVKDLNSPLPTVALCPSLEFASHIASKARCAKLTFTSHVVLT